MQNKIAVIFGGTGFIGRQIIQDMAAQGILIKVATRVPESAYFLKPLGSVSQIVPLACDGSEESINQIIKGADYVINCIGILYERGKSPFQRAHIDTPKMIAEACTLHKVQRFVHISALACERGTSKYAKSKVHGEEAVKHFYPDVSILRPSVVFGEDDSFFNMFAKLSRMMPFLPLIGGGHTKFQPVYVGDIARAVMTCLEHEETKGQIFELCGPETLTFREIYERLFTYTKRPRRLITLPFMLAKIQAFFMSFLPKPPLTPDQVDSLKTDNIMNEGAMGLHELGLTPTPLNSILPTYLSRYQSGGAFAQLKSS